MRKHRLQQGLLKSNELNVIKSAAKESAEKQQVARHRLQIGTSEVYFYFLNNCFIPFVILLWQLIFFFLDIRNL